MGTMRRRYTDDFKQEAVGRRLAVKPLAPQAAAAQTGHLGCRSGLVDGWRLVVHAARAALTSGRSCSLASSVFFEAKAVADEPARERGGISFCAFSCGEFGRELRHRHIGFFGDAGEQKRPMLIELGVAPSAARLGDEPSGRPKSLHQPDDERNRNSEMRGSSMT